MLGIIWMSGYNVSFHSDEMDMNVYAKKNLAYYASGGEDTGYLHIDYDNDGAPANSLLRYYPSGFDYLAITVNNVIGNGDGYEYNIRHGLNQLFAVLAILFAGLIASMLVNYRAGLITVWLLFLTPIFFGLALFNTKDVPFSTGYIVSVYFILRYIQELPAINKKTVAALIISIAFACSVRIGGFLLIAYLVVFAGIFLLQNKSILQQRKLLTNIAGSIALVVSVVLLLLIAGWPYVLTSPFAHLQQALNVAVDFPQSIPINFNGAHINSLEVPKTYLLVYFIRTVPVLILIAFCCSLGMIWLCRKRIYNNGVWLLLAAAVFPVLYALTKDLSLYNSWRHFLFIYPPFVVVTGMGVELLLQRFNKPVYQYAITGVLVVGMLPPVLWTVRTHPYEYMYYNVAAGGFKNNYYTFETDYWQISTREGMDWLIEHEQLNALDDTVTIATNSILSLDYYMKKCHPDVKVKLIYSGYAKRASTPWTYGVFSNIFQSGAWLKKYFPPKEHLVHTVEADGMPLTVVLKDTVQHDNIAQGFYYQNKFKEADSVFSLLRQQNKDTLAERYKPLLGMMAFSKAGIEQYDSAQYFAEQALAYNELSYEGNLVMGILSYYKNDIASARKYLNIAVQVKPDDTQAKGLLQHLSTPE